jgi:hypothetical protein
MESHYFPAALHCSQGTPQTSCRDHPHSPFPSEHALCHSCTKRPQLRALQETERKQKHAAEAITRLGCHGNPRSELGVAAGQHRGSLLCATRIEPNAMAISTEGYIWRHLHTDCGLEVGKRRRKRPWPILIHSPLSSSVPKVTPPTSFLPGAYSMHRRNIYRILMGKTSHLLEKITRR